MTIPRLLVGLNSVHGMMANNTPIMSMTEIDGDQHNKKGDATLIIPGNDQLSLRNETLSEKKIGFK